MTVLNMTQLTQTANVSFNDFVAAYRTGNNISRIYYMQLANAASDAGGMVTTPDNSMINFREVAFLEKLSGQTAVAVNDNGRALQLVA